ncbi:hypothetical protein ACEPAF_1916 [Sanghuangporus sanghuang]
MSPMELWQAGWSSFWLTLCFIWFSSLVFVVAQQLRGRVNLLRGFRTLWTWVERQDDERSSPFRHASRRFLLQTQRLAVPQPGPGERMESALARISERLDSLHGRLDRMVSTDGQPNQVVSALRHAVIDLDNRLTSVDRSLRTLTATVARLYDMGSQYSENLTVEGQTLGEFLAHIQGHVGDAITETVSTNLRREGEQRDVRINYAFGILQARILGAVTMAIQGSQSALAQQVVNSQQEIIRLTGTDFLQLHTQASYLVEQVEAIRARISNAEEELAAQYSITEGIRRIQQTIRLRQSYLTQRARRGGARLSPDSPLQGRGLGLASRFESVSSDSDDEQMPGLIPAGERFVDQMVEIIRQSREPGGTDTRTGQPSSQLRQQAVEVGRSYVAEVVAEGRLVAPTALAQEEQEVEGSIEVEEDLPDYVSTDTQPGSLDQQAEELLREVIPGSPQPWPSNDGWGPPPDAGEAWEADNTREMGYGMEIRELMWNEQGELVEGAIQRLGWNGHYVERNHLQYPHQDSPPGSPTPSALELEERKARLQAVSEYSPDSDYIYDPIIRPNSCPIPSESLDIREGLPRQGVANMARVVWVRGNDGEEPTSEDQEYFDANDDWETEEESEEHESGEERYEAREERR